MKPDNLFSHIPSTIEEELFEDIQKGQNVRVERIISDGHSTPVGEWYDQHEHEWVSVLRGEGIIEYVDGTQCVLKVGDYVNIPARTKHRVYSTSNTEKTIWLAVFYT
ncbi:cupin domain-containing protein [Vibrio methylphosphonaticus]|uniref:cupin domain-containing protein n=1 Tax=Vibrio methylphosphonaticus TaxID=2946866 RepID=UPI002029CD0B|nr:cupin domain-containing protein [Vibrio methylphosphonaticus]MCL9776278.1 cupin domain-containing protein [Vibrio methylphosphonaticus]